MSFDDTCRGVGGSLLTVLLLWSSDGHAQRDPGAPSADPVPGFASVDIGGRSLRYKCIGDGTPTVIIDRPVNDRRFDQIEGAIEVSHNRDGFGATWPDGVETAHMLDEMRACFPA